VSEWEQQQAAAEKIEIRLADFGKKPEGRFKN
jgi:hypothetical protein